MHPILFRIPLPHMPLKLWWALATIAVLAIVYGLVYLKKSDRNAALSALGVAAALGVAGWVFRATKFEAPNLPIYSYGVMLGLSLVAGWYLTLTLAERDGLPKEVMANCYVVTALSAIVGSRVLYVVTNLDEFHSFADLFALRRGGLVAYGGFLGGFLGSWAFLSSHRIRLMPWADVAVPSLASGLMITRVGCYLFGCDFGKRLPDGAPELLKKLGTFPHWAQGTLEHGDGAPAYTRHLELFGGTPLGSELSRTNASLPVHPTQIYESLVGLGLLSLLLWQRKNQKFRGQVFFMFVFAYGVARFLLEILRDDPERGEFGIVMGEHLLIPGALLLLALGFIFGIALSIRNPTMRTVARALALVPPLAVYLMLKPATFGQSVSAQLSTSQWIAIASALVVAYFYAKFWQDARRNRRQAMDLGLPPEYSGVSVGSIGDPEKAKLSNDVAEDEDDDGAADDSPVATGESTSREPTKAT